MSQNKMTNFWSKCLVFFKGPIYALKNILARPKRQRVRKIGYAVQYYNVNRYCYVKNDIIKI